MAVFYQYLLHVLVFEYLTLAKIFWLIEAGQTLEVLPVAPPPEPRPLTEEEMKCLEEQEKNTLRELRIFLRDVTHRLAIDRRFKAFTKPVDPEEVKWCWSIMPFHLCVRVISQCSWALYRKVSPCFKDCTLSDIARSRKSFYFCWFFRLSAVCCLNIQSKLYFCSKISDQKPTQFAFQKIFDKTHHSTGKHRGIFLYNDKCHLWEYFNKA